MTDQVDCQLCHKPVRSGAARARRIGSQCWRKLRPDQRAAITQLTRRGRPLGPDQTRAALNRPAPAGDGQMPFPAETSASQEQTHA